MRTTQQMSITLPKDMAGLVKTKMRSGEYASESEVIRDGLRALIARYRAVESWLNSQVAKACARFPFAGHKVMTCGRACASQITQSVPSSPSAWTPRRCLTLTK